MAGTATTSCTAATGDDTLDGSYGDDKLYGGDGDDTLRGNRGDDTLKGSHGNDRLHGGKGDDELYGGRDDDTLIGGRGDDTLSGSWGADRFVFDRNDGHDTITDFGSRKILDPSGNVIGMAHDVIVIKGGKVFEDLTIKENANGDAVVTGYGEDVSITLEDVAASELTESDFEFLG